MEAEELRLKIEMLWKIMGCHVWKNFNGTYSLNYKSYELGRCGLETEQEEIEITKEEFKTLGGIE